MMGAVHWDRSSCRFAQQHADQRNRRSGVLYKCFSISHKYTRDDGSTNTAEWIKTLSYHKRFEFREIGSTGQWHCSFRPRVGGREHGVAAKFDTCLCFLQLLSVQRGLVNPKPPGIKKPSIQNAAPR